ncbi:hypothetical protein NUSPORA_01059 [Nucleospora cyclopteri]
MVKSLKNTPQLKIREIWCFINLLFLLNYTLRILSLFVRAVSFPNFINCFLLVLAYAITIYESQRVAGDFTSNPNIVAIFFFIMIPPWFLLLPYYLLSIYHTVNFIVTNEKTEKIVKRNNLLHKILLYVYKNRGFIGEIALYFEILNIFICLFTFRFNFFIISLMIVRHQYFINSSMKKVVIKLKNIISSKIEYAPKPIQKAYLVIGNYFNPKNEENKNIKNK